MLELGCALCCTAASASAAGRACSQGCCRQPAAVPPCSAPPARQRSWLCSGLTLLPHLCRRCAAAARRWVPINSVGELFPLALVVMIVDLLESTSIARALAGRNG
jgi:hypothetical protein